MQKFKNFLEGYVDNKSAQKEWYMAARGYLPLTPSILKEFNKEVDLAYHTTGAKGLVNLTKIQGQKKTVSAFSKGDINIAGGARQLAEVLVSLSGVSGFDAEQDFNSQLSRNGYKWLDPFKTTGDYIINNKFTVKMNKKMINYLGVSTRFQITDAVDELDGKGKGDFVKWYLDESKKIINKELLDSLRDSIRKDSGSWKNNELFLHDIKIKEVHIITRGEDDIKQIGDLIKELGLNFAGYITPKEIANLDI